MKFLKKNNLLLIIVNVSASTRAFVGTVCLIAVAAQFWGEQDVVDAGELVRPVSVHRLVLLLPDVLRIASLIHLSTMLPSLSMCVCPDITLRDFLSMSKLSGEWRF